MKPTGMPVCHDTRVCFARRFKNYCSILVETYDFDGKCKFCKEEIDVTNGKVYPMMRYSED